jgi:hypothetical protein
VKSAQRSITKSTRAGKDTQNETLIDKIQTKAGSLHSNNNNNNNNVSLKSDLSLRGKKSCVFFQIVVTVSLLGSIIKAQKTFL